MTDVRGKYPGVPRCDESASDYRYRAVETKHEGLSSFDLIPESTPVADDLTRNPFLRDMPKFDRFGDSSVCKTTDPLRPNQSALYFEFRAPLSRGGRNQPYPFQIPLCSQIQPVRRLLKVHDENSNIQPAASNPQSRLAPSDIDPSENDIERVSGYLEIGQAGGLCQRKISSFPVSYGIFISGAYDPLAQFEQRSQKPGIEETVKAMAEIREHLPKHMQSCMPSDASTRSFLKRYETLMKQFIPDNRAFVGEEVSTIEAPGITSRLLGALTRLNLDGDKIQVIEDVVAFGLRQGLVEDEFIPIAKELVKLDRGPEEFIYALATIVSLRVARELHRKNLKSGGISGDFEDFSRSVENAIKEGRVGIRIKTVADMALLPMGFAYYDIISNQMAFPPITDGHALAPDNLAAFIHECYHLYQNMKRRKLSTVEAEREAHKIHTISAALMSQAAPPLIDDQFAQPIYEEAMHVQDEALERATRSPLCESTSAASNELRKKIVSYTAQMQIMWSGQAFASAQTGQNSSDETFYSFYLYLNLLGTDARIATMIGNHAESEYALGQLGSREYVNKLYDEYLKSHREFYSARTPEAHALAAYKYLAALTRMISITHYMNPKLQTAMIDTYYSESPAIAAALLDMPYQFDGLE